MKRQTRGPIQQDHGPRRAATPPAPCGVSSPTRIDSNDPASGGVFCCAAFSKLDAATRRTGAGLSIGLEPSPEYLPAGFTPTMQGYEAFLRGVIGATADLAAAFKFNLAFFESLGSAGWAMLERVRTAIPAEVFIIADAKRGDIGSTATHYASALYDGLGADAATVNPLMGRDSAAPFLSYTQNATYFLALTSNPGADDFLVPGGLYREIVRRVGEWGSTAGNAGIVVGATRPDRVAEVRGLAGEMPMLVPGVGAQGGDLEATLAAACTAKSPGGGALIHVTRGVLPGAEERGDAMELIRAKAASWRDRIRAAAPTGGGES